MKIFLQNRKTHLYCTHTKNWTKYPADALDFPNYDKAVEFALENKIRDVQVILKFSDCPYDIRLPFRKILPPPLFQA